MSETKFLNKVTHRLMAAGVAGMTFRIVTFGLSLGFCLAVGAEAHAYCTRPSDTVKVMRAALLKDKTIKQGKAGKDLQFFHTAAPGNVQEMWTFTRPGHPAYPGFSCFKVGPWVGGSAPVRYYVNCKADDAACDRFGAEIKALTEPVLKQWKTD